MRGGNLQHDLPLLVALGDLSRLTGEDKYREAADAYLGFFLENCTQTPTGLWPWGEHAHWDFYEEQVGHTIHEHLGMAPRSFWEKAWELRPEAIVGEADGLINHVVNLETFDFNRHANVLEALPEPRAEGMTFLDFPRHGGFYMGVWAFAYSKTGDEKYLDWITAMMDHFEDNTHPDSGLMRMATAERGRESARLTTAVSAGLTMLESVPLLGDTPQAERCETMARRLITSVANLPHRLEEREFVRAAAYAGPSVTDKLKWHAPGFAAHYGGGTFLGTEARMWVLAWKLTGEQRCLDIARAMAACYAEVELLPETEHTRAQVFGTLVNLMVDMHEADGGEQWLPAAERYGQQAIGKLYYDGLFRGATNLCYYESELWVSNLVHSLLRLHAATSDGGETVDSLFFAR